MRQADYPSVGLQWPVQWLERSLKVFPNLRELDFTHVVWPHLVLLPPGTAPCLETLRLSINGDRLPHFECLTRLKKLDLTCGYFNRMTKIWIGLISDDDCSDDESDPPGGYADGRRAAWDQHTAPGLAILSR